jgi:hypothetical protein
VNYTNRKTYCILTFFLFLYEPMGKGETSGVYISLVFHCTSLALHFNSLYSFGIYMIFINAKKMSFSRDDFPSNDTKELS